MSPGLCEVSGADVLAGVLFDRVGTLVCAEIVDRSFATLGDKIGRSFIDLRLW